MMTKTERLEYLGRLDAASKDWADSRALTVEMTPVEGTDGIRFELDGSIEAVWSPNLSEDDLWGFLDDYLDEARPAGHRSLPKGLTRRELENRALVLTYGTPFSVDFNRTNTREFRVTVLDVVTSDIEYSSLSWQPATTARKLLSDLEALIDGRVDEVRDRQLTPDEYRLLAQLPPSQLPPRAERAFLGDLPLSRWLQDALKGSLMAHWRLRQLLEAMRPRPEGAPDFTLN
jgi:hypothetical protein